MVPLSQKSVDGSEDRLWTIVQQTPAAMAVTDLQGQILEANAAFCRILNRTPEEAKRESIQSLTHPEDLPRNQAELNKLASGKSSCFVIEKRYLRPDGSEVWVRNSCSALHDGDGRPVQLVVVSEDIAEWRKAEEALRESQRLAAVGRLATSIAHEINNPLEVITNLLFLIQEAESPKEIQRFAEMAQEELGRVTRIVVQRLGFHKEQPSPTATDMAALTDSILLLYQGKLAQAGVRLRLQKQDSPTLVCFPGEIRQMLVNLIGNAVDAMAGGGKAPHTGGPGYGLAKQARGGTHHRSRHGPRHDARDAEAHPRTFFYHQRSQGHWAWVVGDGGNSP